MKIMEKTVGGVKRPYILIPFAFELLYNNINGVIIKLRLFL